MLSTFPMSRNRQSNMTPKILTESIINSGQNSVALSSEGIEGERSLKEI